MRGRPRPAPQGALASDTVTPSTALTRYTLRGAGCARWKSERFVALVCGVAPVLVNPAGRLFVSTQIHVPLPQSAPANAAALQGPVSRFVGQPPSAWHRRAGPQFPELRADQRQRRHA